MCYHYSLTKKQEEIMKMIAAEWEMPFEPVHHASGFAFPVMPVITQQQPDKVQAYTWGLIPHWVKSGAEAQKLRAQTLNARAETLFEKPSFRTYARQRRCIALADGFFEWMEFAKKKYPHFVQLKEGALFGFAGVYSHWTDEETGELLRTFSIATTEANPLMARIHNTKQRMPVILPQEKWKDWLNPEAKEDELQELLQPCPDSGMQAHTVSKLITTRGADTNVPDIHASVEYPELALAEK